MFQTPTGKGNRSSARFCRNPRPNICLHQGTNFRRVSHTLVENNRIYVIPYFPHDPHPNCISHFINQIGGHNHPKLDKV